MQFFGLLFLLLNMTMIISVNGDVAGDCCSYLCGCFVNVNLQILCDPGLLKLSVLVAECKSNDYCK